MTYTLNLNKFATDLSDWVYIWTCINAKDNLNNNTSITFKSPLKKEALKENITEAIYFYFDMVKDIDFSNVNTILDFSEWIKDILALNFEAYSHISNDKMNKFQTDFQEGIMNLLKTYNYFI